MALLLSVNALGQWQPANGPTGGDVEQLAVNGSTILAGNGICLYRSTDSGNRWEVLTPEGPLWMTSLSALGRTGTTFIAGTGQDLYRTTDSGEHWVHVNAWMLGSGISCLLARDSVLFVLNSSGLCRSVDSGSHWSVALSLVPPYSRQCTDLTASDSGMWFRTNSSTNSSIYRSTDNGITWAPFITPYRSGYFTALAGKGHSIFAATTDGLLRSTNNGEAWVYAKTGLPSAPTISALRVCGSVLFALFAREDSSLYRSTDDGETWNLVRHSWGNATWYTMERCGDTFLAGTSVGVQRSTDSGMSWDDANQGWGNSSVALMASNGSTLYAGTSNGLFKSTASATSWKAINADLPSRTASAFVVRGTTLFVSLETGGMRFKVGRGVYRSTDDGASWSGIALSDSLITAMAVSGERLFVATEGGWGRGGVWGSTLHYTTDDGDHWTAVDKRDTLISLLAAVDSNVFAATSAGMYRFSSNVHAWTAINHGLENVWVTSFTATNQIGVGRNLFVGSPYQGIYRTTDNGEHWTPVNQELKDSSVNALAASGATIFAGTSGGEVYCSTDNGLHWDGTWMGAANTSVTSLVVSGGSLYSGTQGNGVWRRALSELITGSPRSPGLSPEEFRLEQNYPNPFNPSTTIRYALPHRSNVTLTVFNMLGQQVSALINGEVEAGFHEVHFDASGLASGLYFYRLQTGELVQTKGLLILR